MDEESKNQIIVKSDPGVVQKRGLSFLNFIPILFLKFWS